MLRREQVIEAIHQLPPQFSIDQAIDKLILLDKIDTGLVQTRDNLIIADEQLDQELPEWLK